MRLRTVPRRALPAGVATLAVLATLVVAIVPAGAAPPTTTTAARTPVEVAPYVVVDGPTLPESVRIGTVRDPAIGRKMPGLSGVGFDGRKIRFVDAGKPRVVVAFAHWCSHCRTGLPMIVGLQRDGRLPGVEVQAISTSSDPSRENAPPSAWFAREGWTAPVLVDDADTAALGALGATTLSFYVFVDRKGKVAGRFTPSLTATELTGYAKALKAGEPLFPKA